MSTRETVINITADTSAQEKTIQTRGRTSVSIQGDFGGGTLTHFILNSVGRGAAARAGTTVAEAYESHVQNSEFVLTGSTAPDLNIVVTDILGNT